METLLKLLFIVSVLATLWSSARYRAMSRRLDSAAIASMQRLMAAAEDAGLPPIIVPLLVGLTAVTFLFSAATQGFGR